MLPQLALASNEALLKAAVDDYHYSLTVEWDQADKEFLSQKDQAFEAVVYDLVKNGLTKKDLEQAYPNADLESMDLSNAQTVKEYLLNNQTTYQKGASWDGSVFIGIGLGAILVARILYVIITNQTKKKECRVNGGNWSLEGHCWYDK